MINFLRNLWGRLRSYLAPRNAQQTQQDAEHRAETSAHVRRQHEEKLRQQAACPHTGGLLLHSALVPVEVPGGTYLICQHCQDSVSNDDPRYPVLYQEALASRQTFQQLFPDALYSTPNPIEDCLLNLPISELKALASA
jgi:hypothetical protein